MIRPGGLLLVISPPICCPAFSFIIGGVAKEYITKLGCEKYFAQGYIPSTLLEMILLH
jgi:hypothetical protein